MSSFKLVTFASNSTIEDSRYLKKCIYQFHRAHKFYGNASVEIRNSNTEIMAMHQ